MMNMMRKAIENHKQTFDINDPRDFIDKYLTEIENTKDPNSSFFDKTGIENLASTLTDLFIAGSETTSTTLTWAFLYMVRNPEVQQKVQKEIDAAVGRYKIPSLADKPNLPYTEAVLMEIQRCSNIVSRWCCSLHIKDVTVNGVVIP
eukprot:TRINITY_DN26333_c0_g1_i1.p1 TRINITY_DN26333_c0_g1~~TRINITY_DN26333_c0_g1_i1.p1  ORF type:complete len:147 (-),score=23.78 TRINITY_DN26333_c0_g1_i1:435-875(-)